MNRTLRQNFFRNGFSFGSWITFTSTASAEIMARAGFSWLAIDMEHSPISIERAQELMQVIELGGTIPLVRLSSNDAVEIKRVMDSGAYGIIVPCVDSPEDISSAIAATRYPPTGTRGVGLARAQGYGGDFEEYKNRIDRDAIVIAQIEHKEAVERIDDILAVDGLTGIMIGPYDLSGSYGVPGKLDHPKVIAAEKMVLKAARRQGVPAGAHIVFPDAGKLKKKVKDGYTILAFGVDMIFLLKECKDAIGVIRSITR